MSSVWIGRGERRPAVAGTFYPEGAKELAHTVDSMLDDAGPAPSDSPKPRALIAPHAGYVYSGPVAASVYVRLRPFAHEVRRVMLVGPAHRVAIGGGMALSAAEGWRTPLGVVPLDPAGCTAVAANPGVVVDDRPHEAEHSLEVHLPFLQRVLDPGWTLVPVVVGRADPSLVGAVIESVWDDPATLVVISTDLSHYFSYERATALDRATAEAIIARSPVAPDRACGAFSVDGLLQAVRATADRLTIDAVDVRNSGDTAGSRDRVVGYGSFVVSPS